MIAVIAAGASGGRLYCRRGAMGIINRLRYILIHVSRRYAFRRRRTGFTQRTVKREQILLVQRTERIFDI